MADNQNDEKDARIAELEAQLAAAQAEQEAPAEQEKTVVLKHANGTKVRVGASQVDGLKSAGYKK
jgi:F0F1-type ATP synthase assembly protein I